MTGSSSCLNQSPPDLAASGSQLLADVQGMSTLIMVWPGGYLGRFHCTHACTHTHRSTHTHSLMALFLATRTAYTSMSALGKPSLSTRGPFIPTSPCWGERRGVEGRGEGRRGEGTSRGRDKWHRRTFVSLHSVATYSLNSRHLKTMYQPHGAVGESSCVLTWKVMKYPAHITMVHSRQPLTQMCTASNVGCVITARASHVVVRRGRDDPTPVCTGCAH